MLFVIHASLKEHRRERCICLAVEFKYQQAFSRIVDYTFKHICFLREWLSHPWRLGPVFLCAAAAATSGVTQHLLIHGLLCSSLLRVLLHQLGELCVDGLCRRDETNRCCRLQFKHPNPSLLPTQRSRHEGNNVLLLYNNPRLSSLLMEICQDDNTLTSADTSGMKNDVTGLFKKEYHR